MEGCASSLLKAVVGPEGLRAVGGCYLLIGLSAGVGAGEGDVLLGVPILGEEDVLELVGEGVDARNKGVSFDNGEGAAGAEVILNIDDEEGVGGLERTFHSGHFFFFLPRLSGL